MKTRLPVVILAACCLLASCAYQSSYRDYRFEKIQMQDPNWDDLTVGKLVDRRIEPGMTSDMVVAALGKPDAITHQGDMEKWGYRDTTRVMMGEMRFEDVYVVYLRNGFVVRTVGNPNALSSQPWYR